MRNKKLDWWNIFGTILGTLFVLGFYGLIIRYGFIGDDTNPQDWTINGTWDKAKSIGSFILGGVVFVFGLTCLGQLFTEKTIDSDPGIPFARIFHAFWHSLHPISKIFHSICIVLISVLFSIVILQLTEAHFLYDNDSIDSFTVKKFNFIILLLGSISLFSAIFYLITILFLWITNTNMANNYPIEVQCPKCKVLPYRAGMHWACDKCKKGFDTFKHFGKCPKCNHEHKETVCLSCEELSNHLEFYPER
jgi:hypothetical protein